MTAPQIKRYPIPFLNPNSGPRPGPNLRQKARAVWNLVWPLVLAVLAITIGCAGLYYIGSQFDWGIRPTFTTDGTAPEVTFGDCLHFSVVTIATLGYGDFRPESFSRAVSAAESLSGLVLTGMLVARLVSQQQERLSVRLVRGQLNTEIQRFRRQLRPLLENLVTDCVVVQNVPCDALHKIVGLFASIARYWRFQANEPDLPSTIPTKAAGRLLGEMARVLEHLDSITTGLNRKSIHRADRLAIRQATESALATAVVLTGVVSDSGFMHTHDRVTNAVATLRRRLTLRKAR